jgi:hypothetical protein
MEALSACLPLEVVQYQIVVIMAFTIISWMWTEFSLHCLIMLDLKYEKEKLAKAQPVLDIVSWTLLVVHMGII